MAHALALSLATDTQSSVRTSQPTNRTSQQQQEDADLALARALQQSEQEAAGYRQQPARQREKNSTCGLS